MEPYSDAHLPHSSRPLLSVVVPCYNEEASLPPYFAELERNMTSLSTLSDVELILIDDGSDDRTVDVIRDLSDRPTWSFSVKWISFSRNFGKEAALYAGLSEARGDYIVTMDVDLQDPPDLLFPMLERIIGGDVDSVATRRCDREGEPPIRSAFARLFYRLINYMSDADIVDGARDYRMMTRQMCDSVLSLRERNRFTKGIYGWIGYETAWLPYENRERVAGETKWSFMKLARYAVEGIVSFSTVPLMLAAWFGVALCLVAVGFAAFVVVRAVLFGDPVAGWPSLMTVILLIGGVQLLCLGIIGRYMAGVFLEVKNRPLYFIRERDGSSRVRR